MSDSETESSCSDQFQDAVETVDHAQDHQQVEETPPETVETEEETVLTASMASPPVGHHHVRL
jgi:hypothetical protein